MSSTGLKRTLCALLIVTSPLLAQTPTWLGNRLGLEGLSRDYVEPGPGFKPLQVAGRTIVCDFKRITLGASGWPEAIAVRDQPLLSAPVQIDLQLADGTVPVLAADSFSLQKEGANSIAGSARLQAGDLAIETELRVDFDYTLVYTVRLIPRRPLDIRCFGVVFPMHLPDDKLITAYSEVPNRRLAGIEAERLRHQLNVKDDQPVILGAWNSYWLGNTRHGLSWNFESLRHWHTAKGRELIFTPADNRLRLNFIENPTRLAEPVEYFFYLTVTPVKSMPANWRTWSVGTRYNDMTELGANKLIYWQFWRPGRNETHNNQWVWNPEEVKQIAAFDKARGKSRMHYLAPSLLTHTLVAEKEGKTYYLEDAWLRRHVEENVCLPDYSNRVTLPADAIAVADFAAWRELFADERPQNKSMTAVIAPTPGYIDHSLAAINTFVNDFDIPGIYADGCSPRGNFRLDAPRGAHADDAGETRPFFDITRMRDFFKRARALIRAKDPENGLMITHNSGPRFMPSVSLFDFVLFGETDFYWYQEPEQRDASANGDYYYAHIWGDIDTLKTEFHRQWGMPQVLLPELRGRDRKVFPNPTKGTRTMLCYAIQFDLLYWPLWCDAREVHRFDAVRQTFGMADTPFEIVEFTPYWENRRFQAADQQVRLGYYEKIRQHDPDFHSEPVCRYLLLVSNLQFGQTETVITLPGDLRSVSVISRPDNAPLAVNGRELTLKLEPYDFALLEVSGRQE